MADDLRERYARLEYEQGRLWDIVDQVHLGQVSPDKDLVAAIADTIKQAVEAWRERAEKAETELEATHQEVETVRAGLKAPDDIIYNLVWVAARNEHTRNWLASKGLVVMEQAAYEAGLADLRRERGEADLRAEKAEAARAEATAKLDRLTTRGQIAGEEIELANRRLDLFQREMNEQREVIDDQRRVNGEAISRAEQAEAAIDRARKVHRIHWCEVDGHKLDRTPNPCVNNGICRCGQRDQCPTLAALDSPKDATP